MKTIQTILSTSITAFEKIADQISNLRERSDLVLAPVRKAFGVSEDRKEAEASFMKMPAKKKKEILSAVKLAFNGENPTEEKEKATRNRVARYSKALGLVLRVRSREDELDAMLRKASELGCERGITLETFLEKVEAAFLKAENE